MTAVSKQAAAFLILLSLGVYANTLANGFVLDDIPQITENDALRMPLAQMFWAPYSTDGAWRPVAVMVHRANFAASGLSPVAFHALNMILNAAAVVLLYALMLEILGRPRVAFVTALLYAVHPLHVEAVAPAFSRLELLAALFLFAGWLLHLRGRHWWAAACFALALGSKESAICFLAIIPLADWMFRRPVRAAIYGGYAATTLAFVAMRVHAVGLFGLGSISPVNNPLVSLSAPLRMGNALRLAWFMLGLHVWPARLSADYSYNAIPLVLDWPHLAIWILPLLALLAGWLYLSLRPRWGQSQALFLAGIIYIGGFAVTSNFFFHVGTSINERWAYFPSAGFCLMAALGYDWLEQRQIRLALPLLMVVVTALALRTVVRNRDWKDAFSLATASFEAYPESARSRGYLAWQYVERGDLARAQDLLDGAERIYAEDLTLQENLGSLALRKKDYPTAERHFRKAMRLSAGTSVEGEVVISYASLQMEAGNYRQALALLNSVMVSWPGMTRAYSNRALLYYRQNRLDLARHDAITAILLNPNNTQAVTLWQRLQRVVQPQDQPARPPLQPQKFDR
jgi:tetratricopeptide (TPR) repeat protein